MAGRLLAVLTAVSIGTVTRNRMPYKKRLSFATNSRDMFVSTSCLPLSSLCAADMVLHAIVHQLHWHAVLSDYFVAVRNSRVLCSLRCPAG